MDQERDIAAACKHLAGETLLGFRHRDSGRRSGRGVTFRVSLLQLSTREVCYLFRLNRIPLDKAILKILEDRRILKIGADVAGDLRSLRQIRHFRDGGFVDLQTIAPNGASRRRASASSRPSCWAGASRKPSG